MDTASASSVAAQRRSLIAPAKINLALHVTGQRADGYHLLDSLVVFAGDGDRLDIEESDQDALIPHGPFAAGLPSGDDNIVQRALKLARLSAEREGHALPPLRITLHKALPVASGIGGGSADAAAVLRYVGERFPNLRKSLTTTSLQIGADLPMCCEGTPSRVEGIGETVTPLPGLPAFDLLLVNPGVGLSTPAVFRALTSREQPPLPSLPAAGFRSLGALINYLQAARNDLEAPAIELAPSIAHANAALHEEGAIFSRMSGSGATVFGIFPDADAVRKAATAVAEKHPDWWVLPTRVEGVSS